MTTTQTTALTYFEQRGTLTYVNRDYTYTTVQGWFFLDRGTVIMRKIGGRKHFCFRQEAQVLDFELHKK